MPATWAALFERAGGTDATEATVREALAARREDDGERPE
jgi:hypothetical protein